MRITLLTHSTELSKSSNTGALVLNLAADYSVDCERVIWQRKVPDERLLQWIEHYSSGLLYPHEHAQPLSRDALPEHLVLIDSTWQQARKIHNQSAYLKALPHYQLPSGKASEYTLRRNQRGGGLCTSECVSALARLAGLEGFASALDDALAKLTKAG